MKKILAFVLALVMALSLAACGSSSSTATTTPNTGTDAPAENAAPENKGTILIGVSASSTGSAPINGQRTIEGARLAVEEINAAGGVLGMMLELYEADDGGTTDTAMNAINLIASQNVVAQVGPNLSGLTMAIESIMSDNKIPFLVGATSPKLVNEVHNEYMFRIRASDSIQASVAAKYITDDLGCTKIGLLTDSDDYGSGAKNVAIEYFENNNIEYVSEEFNSGDADLSAQVLKLQAAGVDGIIVWAHDTETALAAQNLYDYGMTCPIVGSTSISTAQVINLCETEWLTNWYSVTDFTSTNPDERVATFVKNFNDKYGADPELYAATYYSSIYIVADAIERAGSIDREAIREALTKTSDFNGGVLATYTADENREMVHQSVICQIVDGVAQYYTTVYVD